MTERGPGPERGRGARHSAGRPWQSAMGAVAAAVLAASCFGAAGPGGPEQPTAGPAPGLTAGPSPQAPPSPTGPAPPSPRPTATATPQAVARLTDPHDARVTLATAGVPRLVGPGGLAEGVRVFPSDRLETDATGTVVLDFADLASCSIWHRTALVVMPDPGTHIRVERTDGTEDGLCRRASDRPFTLVTAVGRFEPRGTVFWFAYRGGAMTVIVHEGSGVLTSNGGQSMQLAAQQGATVRQAGAQAGPPVSAGRRALSALDRRRLARVNVQVPDPQVFSGTITFDSRPAPAGTRVEARAGSVLCGAAAGHSRRRTGDLLDHRQSGRGAARVLQGGRTGHVRRNAPEQGQPTGHATASIRARQADGARLDGPQSPTALGVRSRSVVVQRRTLRSEGAPSGRGTARLGPHDAGARAVLQTGPDYLKPPPGSMKQIAADLRDPDLQTPGYLEGWDEWRPAYVQALDKASSGEQRPPGQLRRDAHPLPGYRCPPPDSPCGLEARGAPATQRGAPPPPPVTSAGGSNLAGLWGAGGADGAVQGPCGGAFFPGDRGRREGPSPLSRRRSRVRIPYALPPSPQIGSAPPGPARGGVEPPVWAGSG